MKKTTAILLGTALLFTTNAFAAQLLTKSEFKKVASQYKKIGTVNTSNEVSVDDAIEADNVLSMLMGEKVEPRRNFIQENAEYVENLDV